MARVVGVYVAYGDESTLEESVRSVKSWVDRLVLYSAPFEGMPELGLSAKTASRFARAAKGTPYSVESREVVTSECDARNGALRMVSDEDWALVIDADEILLGEHTNVRKTELGRALFAARAGTLRSPVGLRIYTTAVLFPGAADAMTPNEYWSLPIVSSMGVQPRVFRVHGADFRPSARGAPGLFIHGERQRATAVDGAVIVNQHVRQTWSRYQADYAWETALQR